VDETQPQPEAMPAGGAPSMPQPTVAWDQPKVAPPPPGAAAWTYADVPNRIFALIIDLIVLFVLEVAVLLVLSIVGLSAGIISTGQTNAVATLVATVVGTAINLVYFVGSWTRRRSTIGMRLLGMQVGNAFDGKTLTTDQGIRRAVALWGPGTLAQYFSSFPGIGGIISLLAFIWTLYLLWTTAKSPTKQGFHDTFANSVVVKAGRVV
jgi:uncharacterized RDD family membrane protein YckC